MLRCIGAEMDAAKNETTVEIIGASFEERLVLRADEVVGDILDFYDRYGDETNDTDEAVSAVIEWRDGSGFSTMSMRDEATSPTLH